MGETITLLIPGDPGDDPYGDNPGTETEVNLHGMVIYPHTSTEASGRTGTVTEGLTVIDRENLDVVITSQMKVRARGKVYEIEGEPGLWTYLDGSSAGRQFELTRGQG
jgi:hypothetical protein